MKLAVPAGATRCEVRFGVIVSVIRPLIADAFTFTAATVYVPSEVLSYVPADASVYATLNDWPEVAVNVAATVIDPSGETGTS